MVERECLGQQHEDCFSIRCGCQCHGDELVIEVGVDKSPMVHGVGIKRCKWGHERPETVKRCHGCMVMSVERYRRTKKHEITWRRRRAELKAEFGKDWRKPRGIRKSVEDKREEESKKRNGDESWSYGFAHSVAKMAWQGE